MNCTSVSRRGFFARLMAAYAWLMAREAATTTPHAANAECITSYRYDDLGRLLSVTHDCRAERVSE